MTIYSRVVATETPSSDDVGESDFGCGGSFQPMPVVPLAPMQPQ